MIYYDPFNAATAHTPPAGWTEVVDATYNAGFCRRSVHWIIRGGSAPSYAVTGPGSSSAITTYAITTGTFDATTPMDTTPTVSSQGSTANPSAPSITTTTADTLWIVATGNDASTQTITGPSGFTELTATAGTKSAYKAQAAIGATGTAQFTSATQEWGNVSIAIRSSSAGTIVTPDVASLILATFAPTITRTGGIETRSVTASSDDAQQIGTTMTLNGTTIGGSLDATTDWAAMRFLGVNIPPGADVTSAILQVVPSGTGEDEPLVTIYLEDADNAATYTSGASDISNRSRTAGISWSSTDLGATGSSYHDSSDLAPAVNAVVHRAGWAEGNALSVIIQGGSTTTRDLTIEAYDLGPGTNPPRFVVTWRLLQPATASLTTSTFAPTVTVGAAGSSYSGTPTNASLTTTTFAPTVLTPRVVTPATASLTTATFAPKLDLKLTPTNGALTTATFAPTVTATANQSVTPTTASLTTSLFAPTVTATANQSVTPTTASLATSTFAPTVAVTVRVEPTTASLTLTAFAPTVLTPRTVTPSTASLVTATFAPSVVADTRVVPATASLSLSAFAPSVLAPRLVTPATATLTLAGFAPSVAAGGNQSLTPSTASLTLTTFAPSVVFGGNQNVVPGTASLTLSLFAPTVLTPRLVTPGTASLTTARFAPTVSTPRVVIPDTAALVLTAFAPLITNPQTFTPATAALLLSTFAPFVLVASAIPPSTVVGGRLNGTGNIGLRLDGTGRVGEVLTNA